MEDVLTTTNLCKRYKSTNALQHCTMHVPAGSIYGLIGKNGAGKTTLFRVVYGLQAPTSGTYTLWHTPSGSPDLWKVRRRMSGIIEVPNIVPDLTAEDNLRARFLLLGLTDTERIPGLLHMVGLENTGKKRVSAFSLGMRQRLGVALALAASPDLLILDEPANGLDPQGITEIRELILKLNRDNGTTILVSSHILDEFGRAATHYGFMDAGRIVEEISSRALQDRCRKSIVLTVSDGVLLPPVLDSLGLEYAFVAKDKCVIYGDPDIGSLVVAIEHTGAHVRRVEQRDETLETYYPRLIGGEKQREHS